MWKGDGVPIFTRLIKLQRIEGRTNEAVMKMMEILDNKDEIDTTWFWNWLQGYPANRSPAGRQTNRGQKNPCQIWPRSHRWSLRFAQYLSTMHFIFHICSILFNYAVYLPYLLNPRKTLWCGGSTRGVSSWGHQQLPGRDDNLRLCLCDQKILGTTLWAWSHLSS